MHYQHCSWSNLNKGDSKSPMLFEGAFGGSVVVLNALRMAKYTIEDLKDKIDLPTINFT